MSEPGMIIFYLLGFRLSVIVAGVVAISLGYKLFVLGATKTRRHEEINAEVAGVKVRMMNVAPGSCFALFGGGLIITMLMQSPPEVTQMEGQVTYRGGAADVAIRPAVIPAISECGAIRPSTTPQSIRACWQRQADLLNDHAWYLHQHKQAPELALRLSQLAVVSAPDSPNAAVYADTLASIQSSRP